MLSAIIFQRRYGNQCFDMLFSQDRWLATIRPHPTATIPSSPPQPPPYVLVLCLGNISPPGLSKLYTSKWHDNDDVERVERIQIHGGINTFWSRVITFIPIKFA